ncbi:MAG: hypothetical protein ACI81T_000319 [Bacteroidia bacterium]|jgi:hypothetical protein
MTLEKFIQTHLKELDKFELSGKVWTNIEEELSSETEFHSNIEQFTKSNKEKLDSHEVPSGLWGKIETELNENEPSQAKSNLTLLKKEPKMVSMRVVWQMAASFLLIILAVGVLPNLNWSGKTSGTELEDELTLNEQIAEVAPELIEAERYYSNEINQRLVQLKQMNLSGTGVNIESFEDEMLQLGSVYEGMKEEFMTSEANERVLSAMVENLQMRMEILNRQLQALEQIKEIKNRKDYEINL